LTSINRYQRKRDIDKNEAEEKKKTKKVMPTLGENVINYFKIKSKEK
jgi:hypothetical protein